MCGGTSEIRRTDDATEKEECCWAVRKAIKVGFGLVGSEGRRTSSRAPKIVGWVSSAGALQQIRFCCVLILLRPSLPILLNFCDVYNIQIPMYCLPHTYSFSSFLGPSAATFYPTIWFSQKLIHFSNPSSPQKKRLTLLLLLLL